MIETKIGDATIIDWVRELNEVKVDIRSLEQRKVDEKMMDLKFERITEDIKGVKSDIKEIHTKLSKKSTAQLGSIVTLVVAIIGAAVFILKMDSNVGNNTKSLKTLTTTVGEVKKSAERTEANVSLMKKNEKEAKKERFAQLRAVFEDVLDERIDMKPKRKKR